MKKLSVEFASFLLVLLFTYTSFSKLLDLKLYAFQMRLSPWYPIKIAAEFLAWTVPLCEAGIVLMLLFTATRIYGLLVSLILLSLFELYIAGLLLSGLDLPCTCGGIISMLSWKQHIGLNAVLIFFTAVAILNYDRGNKQVTNRAPFLHV